MPTLDFGVFERAGPLSRSYGIDRGGAVDRHYIDPFVQRCIGHRRGAFLEFGWARYKRFVPPCQIDSYDVIDVDPHNPHASLVGDVQRLSAVADERFDVVVCTQVLQYVEEPARAIHELHRVLRRGGLLVLTTPFIAREDRGSQLDCWRFSKGMIRRLLAPFTRIDVTVGGNVFATVCFLAGMGMQDIAHHPLLDQTDADHYIVVLAHAVKDARET